MVGGLAAPVATHLAPTATCDHPPWLWALRRAGGRGLAGRLARGAGRAGQSPWETSLWPTRRSAGRSCEWPGSGPLGLARTVLGPLVQSWGMSAGLVHPFTRLGRHRPALRSRWGTISPMPKRPVLGAWLPCGQRDTRRDNPRRGGAPARGIAGVPRRERFPRDGCKARCACSSGHGRAEPPRRDAGIPSQTCPIPVPLPPNQAEARSGLPSRSLPGRSRRTAGPPTPRKA
jgi:hypothetical protein